MQHAPTAGMPTTVEQRGLGSIVATPRTIADRRLWRATSHAQVTGAQVDLSRGLVFSTHFCRTLPRGGPALRPDDGSAHHSSPIGGSDRQRSRCRPDCLVLWRAHDSQNHHPSRLAASLAGRRRSSEGGDRRVGMEERPALWNHPGGSGKATSRAVVSRAVGGNEYSVVAQASRN